MSKPIALLHISDGTMPTGVSVPLEVQTGALDLTKVDVSEGHVVAGHDERPTRVQLLTNLPSHLRRICGTGGDLTRDGNHRSIDGDDLLLLPRPDHRSTPDPGIGT